MNSSDESADLHTDLRSSWSTKPRPQPPKQPIQTVQLGTRLFPFEHGQLLAKGGGLQSQLVTRHQEAAEVGDRGDS
jgi:hypothetical protein